MEKERGLFRDSEYHDWPWDPDVARGLPSSSSLPKGGNPILTLFMVPIT
jgi:hypothetical protein